MKFLDEKTCREMGAGFSSQTASNETQENDPKL